MKQFITKDVNSAAENYIGFSDELSIQDGQVRVYNGITVGGALLSSTPEELIFVRTLEDFGEIENGVITLQSNSLYYVVAQIDLERK